MRKLTTPLLLLSVLIFFTACSEGDGVPTAVAQPTVTTAEPTPTEDTAYPEPLIVCLGEEPNTLYPYGKPNFAGRQVMEALYDGPVDYRAYVPQPVILAEIPSLENGGEAVQGVLVSTGTMVFNAAGEVVELRPGVRVRPSGCLEDSCATAYAGGDLQMDQIVVTYKLLPDLRWADGQPLTAADSVYSYSLDAAPETPSAKDKVERTAAYLAMDETTVVWTGLPGYRPAHSTDYFWLPLPAHQWASITPADLPDSEVASRAPLGWGAYTVSAWTPGQEITLQKNPYYHRSAEGLPYFRTLVFRFVGTDAAANLAALRAGECHVLDESTGLSAAGDELLAMQSNGEAGLAFANAAAWEHLDFGIVPLDFDDGYNQVSGDRADFFGDVRTRQALAMCLDREALVEQLAFGRDAVMHTYLPSTHPLFAADAQTYTYDPAGAAALLEQVGWVLGGDGVRYAAGIAGVFDGTPFSLVYRTPEDQLHQTIAQALAQNLGGCGIQVEVQTLPVDTLYANGPEGTLFGRQFDLAQFSWQLDSEPSCQLYLGEAVPGDDLENFPYGWGGWNLTGWSDAEFDLACATARDALPGTDAYISNHQAAQRIFAEELPVVPLFVHQQVAATRPDMCAFDFDETAGSLWNIEAFGYAELCE